MNDIVRRVPRAVPPWNPYTVELTVVHKRLLSGLGVGEFAGQWKVAATVVDLVVDLVFPRLDDPYIGHVTVEAVPLTREPHMLSAAALGWSQDFLDGVVADRSKGRLVADLESRLAPGPPTALVVTEVALDGDWRSAGFALPLLLATLTMLTPLGRFATYKIAPNETQPAVAVAESLGIVPAGERMLPAEFGELLRFDGIGSWNGVQLAGLHDPQFQQRSIDLVRRWMVRNVEEMAEREGSSG